MRYLTASSAVVMAFLACSTASWAQIPPLPPELTQLVRNDLPPFWQLDRIEISEPVSFGNAARPEWRRRLTMYLSPTEDLFVPVAKDGMPAGVTVVSRLIAKGEALVGATISSSWYADSTWTTEFKNENSVIDDNARPLKNFPGRVVIAGSDAEKSVGAEVKAEFLVGLKQDLLAKGQALSSDFTAQREKLLAEQRSALDNLAASFQQSQEKIEAERKLREQNQQQTEAETEAAQAQQRLLDQRNEIKSRILANLDPKDEARSLRVLEGVLASDLAWLKAGALQAGMVMQGKPRILAVSTGLASAQPELKREAFRRLVEGQWTGQVTCEASYTNTYAVQMNIMGRGPGQFTGQIEVTELDRRGVRRQRWDAKIAKVVADTQGSWVSITVVSGPISRAMRDNDYVFPIDKETLDFGSPTLFRHHNQWSGTAQQRGGKCVGGLRKAS